MSPIDTNRLSPIGGVSALASETQSRLDASAAPSRGADDAAKTVTGPTQGVSVDVDVRADAATPPVDSERVAQIRAALQDGTYPLHPTQIADALIAARLMLSTNP